LYVGRSLSVGVVVLAAQRGMPTHDTEIFSYAVVGVVLLVVGCVLSIFAAAKRTANPPRPPRRGAVPPAVNGRTSASVARLLHDVRGWTKQP
jgi:hypothetical protein